MSMRSIDLRLAGKCLFLAAFMAGCSAPMPVPPGATATPPAQTPAIAEPFTATLPSTPSAAAQEPNEALTRQFAKAVAAMKDGKDKQAAALFSEIAKQDPQLASPHTNLGILFYRQDRMTEAEAAFKEALQRDSNDYVAANYLGMIYRGQGRFADAKSAYEQALAAKPDYANAHLNLAILYDLYLGQLDQALDQYQKYKQYAGETDPQLVGWLADLEQRIKTTGGHAQP
jgi:tetratricopeptide (TPR) repeat protein